MALSQTTLYAIIGGGAALVILLAACCIIRRRRRKRRQYSLMGKQRQKKRESALLFNESKLWLGGSNIDRVTQRQQEQRKEMIRDERYQVASRFAANYCKNLRHSRKVIDELPKIGYRDLKFFHLVSDELLAKEFRVAEHPCIMVHYDVALLPCTSKPDAYVDLKNKRHRKVLSAILANINSPFISRTHSIEFGRTNEDLFMLQPVYVLGSMRDAINGGQDLSLEYREKYNAANRLTPFSAKKIRLLGRQIIEALHYFREIGFPYYDLHTGNILMESDNRCRLAGYENAMLGIAPRGSLNRKIKRALRKNPELAPEVAAFAFVLYEMATGKECPSHEPPPINARSYRDVHELIVDILGSNASCRTVDDLLSNTLFRLSNPLKNAVPSEFNAMRDEVPLVKELMDNVTATFTQKYTNAKRRKDPQGDENPEDQKIGSQGHDDVYLARRDSDDPFDPSPSPPPKGASTKKSKKRRQRKEQSKRPSRSARSPPPPPPAAAAPPVVPPTPPTASLIPPTPPLAITMGSPMAAESLAIVPRPDSSSSSSESEEDSSDAEESSSAIVREDLFSGSRSRGSNRPPTKAPSLFAAIEAADDEDEDDDDDLFSRSTKAKSSKTKKAASRKSKSLFSDDEDNESAGDDSDSGGSGNESGDMFGGGSDDSDFDIDGELGRAKNAAENDDAFLRESGLGDIVAGAERRSGKAKRQAKRRGKKR